MSAALAMLVLATLPALAQSQSELQSYQQRLQQLFQRLDQNRDQRLERSEVMGHPYLERHFDRLDQHQRGYLTPADLHPPAASGRGERARRFFQKADRNGDGVISSQEAEPYPWLLRRLNDADRNGDGNLSRDELRPLRGNASLSPSGLR